MSELPIADTSFRVVSPRLHIELIPCQSEERSSLWAVLCHGLGGSARNLRRLAQGMSQFASFVLYDARGHARSESPDEPSAYTLPELVRDLHRVKVSQGGGNWVVGGVSLGALTALRYAMDHPGELRGLLLFSFPGLAETTRKWAQELADAIDQEGLEAAGERFVWGPTGRFYRGPQSELIRRGFLEHSPRALAGLLRHTMAVLPSFDDLRWGLAKIRVPTLVVAGEDDAEAVEIAPRLAHEIPGARWVKVPGAGHVVVLEKPTETRAICAEFLKDLVQSQGIHEGSHCLPGCSDSVLGRG